MEFSITEENSWYILFLIVALIIGFVLGWYMKTFRPKKSEDIPTTSENHSNKESLSTQENIKVQSLILPESRKLESVPFHKSLVDSQMERSVEENDLQIVEGIGPAIEKLLLNSGVTTWVDLSKKTNKELKEILQNGGHRFKMHDPSSWPKQAHYAAQNNWKELKKLKQKLKSGEHNSIN